MIALSFVSHSHLFIQQYLDYFLMKLDHSLGNVGIVFRKNITKDSFIFRKSLSFSLASLILPTARISLAGAPGNGRPSADNSADRFRK